MEKTLIRSEWLQNQYLALQEPNDYQQVKSYRHKVRLSSRA